MAGRYCCNLITITNNIICLKLCFIQLRIRMVHGISWLTTQQSMGKSKPYRSIHCSFFTPTKKMHHSSCFIIDKKNFAGCLKHLYKSSLALPVLNLASSLINVWRFEFFKKSFQWNRWENCSYPCELTWVSKLYV